MQGKVVFFVGEFVMRPFWSVIGMALLVWGCVLDRPGGAVVQPGDTLPSFTVQMEDGSVLSSRDLLGNPSCIIFFNTTCGDCRRTLPHVQRVYEEYGEKVRFVAISREQVAADVREWWNANGITLPFSAQADRAVYSLFAESRIPRIYIVDSEGRIQSAYDDNPCPDYETLKGKLSAF